MKTKATSVLAKSGDGSIQITFSIPYGEIKTARQAAVGELSQNITVPGFRKGKAPYQKAFNKLSPGDVVEKTITILFPELFADAIREHKIKPATYPKLELLKAEEDKPWEIKATTCELPRIKLLAYKKELTMALKTKKKLSAQEKEQMVIETLLKLVEVKIPEILIREETDARLSQLLARIEKLGLTLESYLASIGKNVETMRADYQNESEKTLKLELILNEIADQEKVKVKEEDINKAMAEIKAADNPRQRAAVRSLLRKRAVLTLLAGLV